MACICLGVFPRPTISSILPPGHLLTFHAHVPGRLYVGLSEGHRGGGEGGGALEPVADVGGNGGAGQE